jgi:hypothetical protein
MYEVLESSALPSLALSPESMAARHPPSARTWPHRRLQSNCSDREFVALLEAYRAGGGLARAEELLAPFKCGRAPDLATLARWIAVGQVISFVWQARTWLPLFQFDPIDTRPRPQLGQVLAELNAVYDDWELANWFAMPNLSLAGRTPVQAFASDLSAVVRAARIDRFVVDG